MISQKIIDCKSEFFPNPTPMVSFVTLRRPRNHYVYVATFWSRDIPLIDSPFLSRKTQLFHQIAIKIDNLIT